MRNALLTASLLGLLALTLPSAAEAQHAYVGLGVGPSISIEDWPNQFRIEAEIGASFGGPLKDGFHLSFAPSQSWGANFWTLVFPLRLGGTAVIFHNRDLNFQVGGTGTVGFALSDGVTRRDPDPAFHLSFAFLLRLMLLDNRLGLYLRPVGFEFAIGDSPFYRTLAIRYQATFGVNYYF